MNRLRYILTIVTILMSMDVAAQDRSEIMQLDATSVSNKVVQLQWTLPTIDVEIDMSLYRRLQGEEFTDLGLLDIYSQNSIFDTLPRLLCGDSVEYVLANETYCSNRISVEMVDPIPTSPCQLKVATVDENSQKIELSWFASPDLDIKGYYLCHGNPCLDFDTVWGRTNTSYICNQLESSQVHTFRLLAFDSCMNSSPLTDNFNNIVLDLDYEDCNPEVKAHWNSYQNMPNGLGEYKVMARYDNNPTWNEVATVDANATLQSTVQLPGTVTRVAIKIVAENTDHTLSASSNIVSYDISTIDTAKFLYISSASVNEEGDNITLDLYVDAEYEADKYTLYRSVNGGDYHVLKKLDYNGNEWLSYVDRRVEALENSYRYKLSTLDGCNRNEKFSNEVQTMCPRLDNDGNTVSLQWTDYKGWDEPAKYKVMRRRGEQPWQMLSYVTQNHYTDDISTITDLNEALYYRIVAQESHTNNYGFADSAYSALVPYRCAGYVVFPNAILPNQPPNDLFGPVYSFLESYELYIYNRSGEILFRTTNPEDKWDGTRYGDPVPQGAYVYTAICTFVDKQKKQFTGTVLVIR